jgi:ubiquinone/menaquinone biosynthesis C-methylase UbiE
MNYNKIAQKYNDRYSEDDYNSIKNFLLSYVRKYSPGKILEVGCGTGFWIKYLREFNYNAFGCDNSIKMLEESRLAGNKNIFLSAAEELSVKENSFDMIFCINALHHFKDQEKFICDVSKLVKKNGSLLIISVDPQNLNDKWYLYDYFDGVYQKDKMRFARWSQIADWLNLKGLNNVRISKVVTIEKNFINEYVFGDKFLQKHNCSQLANMSQKEYLAGLNKIKEEINLANKSGKRISFETRITFCAITGEKIG